MAMFLPVNVELATGTEHEAPPLLPPAQEAQREEDI